MAKRSINERKMRFLVESLMDPKTYWDFFNPQFKSMQDMHLDYALVDMQGISNFRTISGGRDTFKTTELIRTLSQHAILNPHKKTVMFYPSDIHAQPVLLDLQTFFESHPFLMLFWDNLTKGSEKVAKFRTNHSIFIRIIGQDQEGSRKGVGIHVSLIVFDEAQLVKKTIFKEVIPTMLPGCKILITGVANDDYNSLLYHAIVAKGLKRVGDKMVEDSDGPGLFVYFRYASFENTVNWTPEREAFTRSECENSEESPAWRNLVLGYWGTPKSPVYSVEALNKYLYHDDLYDGYVDVKYMAQHIREERYRHEAMPPVPDNVTDVWLIIDYGKDIHPSAYELWGHYTEVDDKGNKRIGDSILFGSFQIRAADGNEQARFVDFLDDIYHFGWFGIDVNGPGVTLYDALCGETYKNKRYRDRIFAHKAQAKMVVGYIPKMERMADGREKPIDGEFEEVSLKLKTIGTKQSAKYLAKGRIRLPFADRAFYDEIVATKRKSIDANGDETYVSPKPDHRVDGFRMLGVMRWMREERPMPPSKAQRYYDAMPIAVDLRGVLGG